MTCLTNIYHPNIDPTDCDDNVCLNIFNEWLPCYGLQDCIQGLLFLLHNPNLTDPLSPYFDAFYDEEEFAKNVRKSLMGEVVEGATFDTQESPPATDTTIKHEEEHTLTLETVFADICAGIYSVEGATIQRTTEANTTPAVGNTTVGEGNRLENTRDESTNFNVIMSSFMEPKHNSNLMSRHQSTCDNNNMSTPRHSDCRHIGDKDPGMRQLDPVRHYQRLALHRSGVECLICVGELGYQCVMRALCEPFKFLIFAAKNARSLLFRIHSRAGKNTTC